jgi:hypothetical protein
MSISIELALPEWRAARRAVDRAAGFDDACVVHDEARQRLLGGLQFMRLEPRVVVVRGWATGRGTRERAARYPPARGIALD